MTEADTNPDFQDDSMRIDKEVDVGTFVQPLAIDDDLIYKLAYEFSSVYRELALTSDEQFLPNPVTRLPSGHETGQFLAIDVGGTNLRVAFIELLGDTSDHHATINGADRSRDTIRNAQRPRIRRTLEKAWPIGEHLKVDKTEDLFAWIGDCVAEVVSDYLSNENGDATIPTELDLGITFSFPMIQDELAAASLMPMGKGFTMHENLDLGSTLLKGYERHTRRDATSDDDSQRNKRRRLGPLPSLRIVAITNDAIATLCSLAYIVKSLPNSRVAAGLIVGTGVNATVLMKFDELGAEKGQRVRQKAPHASETVVNTEMTIAGACAPLKPITTKWDVALDKATARPGFQPLEYMTGGRYVGELVRIIFYDFMTSVHRPQVVAADLPAMVVHNYSLTTQFVSAVVARARSDTELAADLKRRMPPPESSNWTWTAHSAGALRKIAQAVQYRSAGLVAASMGGLLTAIGEIALPKPDELTGKSDTHSSDKDGAAPNKTGSVHAGIPIRRPSWNTGPEELVIAYTGGIIQHYPNFKEQCQRFIDKLVMRTGSLQGGKSVFLRESRDGGIIGAGVLAGMESLKRGV